MLSKRVQHVKGYCISSIKSDNCGEFENHVFETFCNEHGISHNFSSSRMKGKIDHCKKWPKLCSWKMVYQKAFG